MMNDDKKGKWYFKTSSLIVALLAIGPLALPLVWFSPALKRWLKVLLTIVTVIITVWLVKATIDIYKIILKEMTELQGMFGQ